MMLTVVGEADDREADDREADLDEVHDMIDQVVADLGLAYLLACSSEADGLADTIHAAMMTLADAH